MRPQEFMIGMLSGVVLLILGLVPGLFQSLVNGVSNGIRNFHDSLLSPLPVRPQYEADSETPGRPIWLAIIGVLIMMLTLTAFLWD